MQNKATEYRCEQGRAQFSPGLLKLMAKNQQASMKALPNKKKTQNENKNQLMPAKNRRGILGLTARETEVLTWIAQGKTNHEIGVILSACTGTICKHVEHILCKLDVKNRTAAAVIALAALAKAKNMSQLVR